MLSLWRIETSVGVVVKLNCLNCGATLAGDAKYCNGLCKHGFQQKQYRELYKEKTNLEIQVKALQIEAEQLRRKLRHE